VYFMQSRQVTAITLPIPFHCIHHTAIKTKKKNQTMRKQQRRQAPLF